MDTYRIISIDGGGIRGIITTVLLQRLSAEPGLEGWLEATDLFAGTSTGGLISLGLAHGISLERLRKLYEVDGPSVFADTLIDDVRDLGRTIGADYTLTNLERLLKDIVGETTLGQLNKQVLVTAFDLDNEAPQPENRSWKPKIFHNFPGSDSDRDVPAYKTGLYTSSAPTFFPSEDGYIDGGVFATNPSMCALAQTQDPRNEQRPELAKIRLLSFGTGISLKYIPGQRHDWGYAQWARPLVEILLDGVMGIADYQCRQMLHERYHRLAPAFAPGVNIPMDAVSKIPEMIAFAEKVDIGPAAAWIREQWLQEA